MIVEYEAYHEMTKIVNQEVNQYLTTLGKNLPVNQDLSWVFFLNSFRFNLPDARFANGKGFAYEYRTMFEESNGQKTHLELGVTRPELYTSLFLNQTADTFAETVISLTEQFGISIEELNKLQETQNKEDYYRIHAMILPVYIGLRTLGYNHHELIS